MNPEASYRFSGRLGMLLTVVGLAVGLGNVWRFPYMMGSYGGSAFLLVYLVFTLLLAVPALSAEWALGRALRAGPPDAYRMVLGKRLGLLIGAVLLITVLVADSYYLVVIAQVLITARWTEIPGFGGHARPAPACRPIPAARTHSRGTRRTAPRPTDSTSAATVQVRARSPQPAARPSIPDRHRMNPSAT